MILTEIERALDSITYSCFKITFEATDEVILPKYKGAVYRGCMGNSFKQILCHRPGKRCEGCKMADGCLFATMYSKPLHPDHPAFGRYTLPPRPYIIEPLPDDENVFLPGKRFGFDLVVIGKMALELAPLLPRLLVQMGETGIGRGRGRFRPVELTQLNRKGEYEPFPLFGDPATLHLTDIETKSQNGSVTLSFENPLRLLSGKKPVADPPDFDRLTNNLVFRTVMMANLYCGAPWFDTETIKQSAGDVEISGHNLEWVNWRHFSGTKQIGMNFDGHTGTITYKGNLSPWARLLTAGEILHAGSTATFGLGKYRIVQDE